MTRAERENIELKLNDYQKKRAILSRKIDDMLEFIDVKSYTYNDADGGQTALRRDPIEAQKQLTFYDNEIDRLTRLLDPSSGIVLFSLRRSL